MLSLSCKSLLAAAPSSQRATTSQPARPATRQQATRSQECDPQGEALQRRQLIGGAAVLAAALVVQASPAEAVIKGYEPMPALEGKDYGKARMTYSDYVQSESGLQYIDLKVGTGEESRQGATCVVDWSGVTIGYYGRPFEARNKPKGGAFTGDTKDFFRFTLGDHSVIPAFEEGLTGMRVGGIRRLIVPVELGYPDNDMNKLGPKPTTFSGQRALAFVLGNRGLIDKTLLFDVELIAVR